MKNTERQVMPDEYDALNVTQTLAKEWIEQVTDEMKNADCWDHGDEKKFGKKYQRKRKRGDKNDKSNEPLPQKKQTLIHSIPLQMILPDKVKVGPEDNEPKINALDDLSNLLTMILLILLM